MIHFHLTLALSLILGNLTVPAAPPSSKPVIAYLFPEDRLLNPDEIAVAKLSRINYAFANLKNGRVVPGFPHDLENLRTLVKLKHRNPGLQILISIGGWSWSGGFSDAALTPETRRSVIDSAVAFLRDNKLDGIDIDWEYPGQTGAGNKHRPQDKENYTALLRELRVRLDAESHKLARPLLTSIAVGASEEFLAHTEMRSVQRYVNTVNLMSYDYYVPASDHITGHHAPLHPNPADPKLVSAASSVALFQNAGVPSGKLILGVPFYGHAWTHVSPANHGLFQPGKKPASDPDFKAIVGLLAAGEYHRYWDPVASAPYLYNPEARTFVSYEDPESLRLKCLFVREQNLGGIMLWEYSNDVNNALLNSIVHNLNPVQK